MRKVLLGGVICLLATQSFGAEVACPGDCGGDGEVTVNELVLGVNIALGATAIEQCPSFDTDGSGDVTINELIAAVNAALNSCPMGNFAGDYAATVDFDATHSGIVNLSANATAQVTGSLLATSSAGSAARFQPAFSFTFPIGGVSVALTGTYDPASGGFEVEGSFIDAGGQTTPVVVSGNLPGPTGSAPINVYIDTDVFGATLSAGMISTPTPTPTVTPTPSPGNGPRLVYSAPDLSVADIFDIFVINVDGSGKAKIYHSPGYDISPAWSPDGTKVAFSTPDANNVHNTIGIANADGSGFHRIGEDGAFLDGNPAWSPNGSQIVFTAGGGDAIDVMNADGSNRHRLVTGPGDEYGHLTWSPDGGKIAFESSRGKSSHHDTDREIFVMNADGSGITALTNNDVEDHHPDWSPDGQKIAFGRGGATAGVYSINPNGSSEKKLISDPFVYGVPSPSWSDDGKQLVYQTLFGLKITDASGANAVTVPNTNFLADFDLK